MIHMNDSHWKIVQSILMKYPYTFYAFGSRVKGTEKRFSDLDLCFTDPIPWNIQSHIEEDFEESDLPFLVDVVDLNLCTKEFKKGIEKDIVLIQSTSATSRKFLTPPSA